MKNRFSALKISRAPLSHTGLAPGFGTSMWFTFGSATFYQKFVGSATFYQKFVFTCVFKAGKTSKGVSQRKICKKFGSANFLIFWERQIGCGSLWQKERSACGDHMQKKPGASPAHSKKGSLTNCQLISSELGDAFKKLENASAL